MLNSSTKDRRLTITLKEEINTWIYQFRAFQLQKHPFRLPELNQTSAINILLHEAIENRKRLGKHQYEFLTDEITETSQRSET